jgi:hypothetical protein
VCQGSRVGPLGSVIGSSPISSHAQTTVRNAKTAMSMTADMTSSMRLQRPLTANRTETNGELIGDLKGDFSITSVCSWSATSEI